MLKRGLISLALIFALVISLCGAAYADVLPMYQMKLTVAQSPLAIYPPVMIYTAQISPIPSADQVIKVDFYNAKEISSTTTTYELLGSAYVDSTGKAVLNKQMLPGTYVAVAKTVINTQSVTSNIVQYVVR